MANSFGTNIRYFWSYSGNNVIALYYGSNETWANDLANFYSVNFNDKSVGEWWNILEQDWTLSINGRNYELRDPLLTTRPHEHQIQWQWFFFDTDFAFPTNNSSTNINASFINNKDSIMSDRAELDTAVNAWITDEAYATTTYGDINTWDVSAITDFSR